MAAIYQWFVGKEVVYTTTLYPLEAGDALDFTVTLEEFSMSALPEDFMEFGVTFLSGLLEDILIEWGPPDDAVDFGVTFVSGLLETILIDWGPPDDYGEFGVTFISGLLEDKLVEIYAPDEALNMAIALHSISMTPV